MSAVAARAPRVCVVLVNWNAWADTIECLESVLRSNYPDFQVIVCDNASTDGSVEKLKAWAHGDDVWPGPASREMARFSTPPLPKPVRLEIGPAADSHGESVRTADVVVLETGANLGFAGGNNAGIRFALAQPGVQFVWLLNNDTVVELDTMAHLVKRMAETTHAGPCGGTLRFYHRPGVLQARCGSRYNRWLGRAHSLYAEEPVTRHVPRESVERRTDFVIGACMFLPRNFLETVGLMDERYFLYFEEIDWAVRAGRKFPPAYAPDAIVYHKEGGSIGSSSQRDGRSAFSEFYLARGKLLFTRKFYPWLLPLIYLVSLVQIMRRLLKGQPEKARIILRACLGAKRPARAARTGTDGRSPEKTYQRAT